MLVEHQNVNGPLDSTSTLDGALSDWWVWVVEVGLLYPTLMKTPVCKCDGVQRDVRG